MGKDQSSGGERPRRRSWHRTPTPASEPSTTPAAPNGEDLLPNPPPPASTPGNVGPPAAPRSPEPRDPGPPDSDAAPEGDPQLFGRESFAGEPVDGGPPDSGLAERGTGGAGDGADPPVPPAPPAPIATTPPAPVTPTAPVGRAGALGSDGPLPAIPPARPSAPPGSRGPGRSRRERREDATDTRSKWPWIVAVVALAVVATIGGVAVRGGSDSGPSTSTPGQDALLRSAAVAASVRADCQGTTRLPAGATDGLACTPGQGADRVRFYRFSSDTALTDYFEEQVSEAGVDTDAEGDCSQVVDVEHAYATVRDLEGQVLCYRAGGRSTLVWTMPEALAVGVAERFDTDDQSLYDWWNLAYQVQLSSVGQRVELTAGEIELLRRIPPEVQPTCGPDDEEFVLRGAVASLACVVADTDVFYTAFASLASMTEVYAEQISLAGIAPGSGGVTGPTCPGEGAYRVGTPNAGNMLCSLDDSAARATWTDGLALVLPDSRPASLPDPQWWILTEAIRLDDQFGPLMELVATLGPT